MKSVRKYRHGPTRWLRFSRAVPVPSAGRYLMMYRTELDHFYRMSTPRPPVIDMHKRTCYPANIRDLLGLLRSQSNTKRTKFKSRYEAIQQKKKSKTRRANSSAASRKIEKPKTYTRVRDGNRHRPSQPKVPFGRLIARRYTYIN